MDILPNDPPNAPSRRGRPAAPGAITQLAEHKVFSNKLITVFDDPVRFADGREGSYLRIVQSGGWPGVAVLPLHQDRVGLVRVYRYPQAEWEWGVPRGLAHGSSPEETAMEEAEEELGARPRHIEEIGRATPDSGLLSSVVHIFAAMYTDEAAHPRDQREVSEVRWSPARELLREVTEMSVRDGFTHSALLCATARGLIRA